MVHGLDRGKKKETMFVKFSDDIKLGGVVTIIDDRSIIHNDFTRSGDWIQPIGWNSTGEND